MAEIKKIHILHLEDDKDDAELIHIALLQADPSCDISVVESRSEYLSALDTGKFNLVLSDSSLIDIDGLSALRIAKQRHPDIPFMFVSGTFNGKNNPVALKIAGATDCVLKAELTKLPSAVRRALFAQEPKTSSPQDEVRYYRSMERLVTTIQKLSQARAIESIMMIVRRTARELTGADGASFVLKEDNDMCFYAEEDAISPLWKGQRFPMTACISGWAMINRQPVVIEDIYEDSRIPHDVYRPTFVKSLAMVPIRTLDPLGAIGIYWAEQHQPTAGEVKLLQALADATALAMENVWVYGELERQVRERIDELQATNKEFDAFAHIISHDLRAPLRLIDVILHKLFEESADTLSEVGKSDIQRIRTATQHMSQLVEELLILSRITHAPVRKEQVDLNPMIQEAASALQATVKDRAVEFVAAEKIPVNADPQLLQVVFENLLSNAWKFTSKNSNGAVEVGLMIGQDREKIYFVRDNGVGFDMARAEKLFNIFHRLHAEKDFPGNGIGLALAKRIVHKHGGRIWAEGAVNAGACFYFTLG